MDTNLLPQFIVFAKRKNSKDPSAKLYVKVTYNGDIHERSLGIGCPYELWESEQMTIKDQPIQSARVKQTLEEIKQKVIGIFHILSQHGGTFSLKDIIEITNGNRKPAGLSFCQCFEDVIARMEKLKGYDGNSEANIQKHKRCFDHFKTFCKLYYKSSDFSYHKITRTVVDQLAEYLKTEGNCSHNTAMKYMQIVKKVLPNRH